MSFNEKLQFLRKESKLSQEQLADMLDVTRQSVSKWESGTTYPEMDKLIMLCKIFKCSLDDLTNDEIIEINKKSENVQNSFLSNILEIINKSVKMFKAMSFKQVIGCIVSMVILALVLLIFRIPFELIENGFESLIVSVLTTVRAQKIVSGIFCFIVDIIYYALYILIYVYIYKVAYLDKYEFSKNENTVKQDTTFVNNDKERIVEQTKEVMVISNENKDYSLFKFLGNLILGFVKFLAVCFSLPVVFALVVLFFLIVISIYLMFDGIFFIGILLGLLFAVLLVIWFLVLVSLFVFNKSISFKKMLIIFLAGIIGVGVSSGIVALEIAGFDYSNSILEDADKKSAHYEIDMNDKLYVEGIYYDDVKYVIDNTKNDVSVDVDYYGKFYKIDLEDTKDYIAFNVFYPADYDKMKFVWTSLKKCLKEKVFYDFDELGHFTVTLTASSDNIEKIKANTKKVYDEREVSIKASQYDYYEMKISEYEERIDELNETNSLLQEKIEELENFKSRVQDSLNE